MTCLDRAGVRYAVLGQEESCTGDPARRMGNEYVFQMLATANVETLERYRPKTVITACPHCFNTLGNEYAHFGGRYEVVHHSTYLVPPRRRGPAADRTAGDGTADGRRQPLDHLPRLVLPRPLQRHHRRPAARS